MALPITFALCTYFLTDEVAAHPALLAPIAIGPSASGPLLFGGVCVLAIVCLVAVSFETFGPLSTCKLIGDCKAGVANAQSTSRSTSPGSESPNPESPLVADADEHRSQIADNDRPHPTITIPRSHSRNAASYPNTPQFRVARPDDISPSDLDMSTDNLLGMRTRQYTLSASATSVARSRRYTSSNPPGPASDTTPDHTSVDSRGKRRPIFRGSPVLPDTTKFADPTNTAITTHKAFEIIYNNPGWGLGSDTNLPNIDPIKPGSVRPPMLAHSDSLRSTESTNDDERSYHSPPVKTNSADQAKIDLARAAERLADEARPLTAEPQDLEETGRAQHYEQIRQLLQRAESSGL
jgi:hypothetical protein